MVGRAHGVASPWGDLPQVLAALISPVSLKCTGWGGVRATPSLTGLKPLLHAPETPPGAESSEPTSQKVGGWCVIRTKSLPCAHWKGTHPGAGLTLPYKLPESFPGNVPTPRRGNPAWCQSPGTPPGEGPLHHSLQKPQCIYAAIPNHSRGLAFRSLMGNRG